MNKQDDDIIVKILLDKGIKKLNEKRLKENPELKKITRAEVAKKLKFTNPTFYNWKEGKVPKVIKQLALFLKMTNTTWDEIVEITYKIK